MAKMEDPEQQPEFSNPRHRRRYETLLRLANRLTTHEGLLYKTYQFEREIAVMQFVVPQPYEKLFFDQAHSHPLAGHLDLDRTLARLRTGVYWPQMESEVQDWIRACRPCIQHNPCAVNVHRPLHQAPLPVEPLLKLQVDFKGPLPRTNSGQEYWLTVIDCHSGFVWGFPTQDCTSSSATKALRKLFLQFKPPSEIQTDNGKHFTSKEFVDFLNDYNIRQTTSTPYHPESQGQVERANRALSRIIAKYIDRRMISWPQRLREACYAINSATNSTRKTSPFELLFRCRPWLPTDIILPIRFDRPATTDIN